MTKHSHDKVVTHHGKLALDINLPEHEFTYGVPNRPSTPIKEIVSKFSLASEMIHVCSFDLMSVNIH